MKRWILTGLLMVLLSAGITVQAGAVKLIAMTFDDGPNAEFTPKVAEALDSRNAKGTFFMVGSWVFTKGGMIQELAANGHQIASHTWAHEDLSRKTAAEIQASVSQNRETLGSITGQQDFLVRTPFGVRTDRVRENINSPLVLWSQDPAAGAQVPGDVMARRVISSAKDGDIILLHDSNQANLDAAIAIVEGLQAKGFEFVTVDELFRLRGASLQNGVIYKCAPPAVDPQAYDENALSTHWAWTDMQALSEKGIMTGSSRGWQPNRYLTWAEAAVALWRAAGAPAAGEAPFYDVPAQSWYANAVAWATEAGVAEGITHQRFSPEALVTRQQLFVMVSRLAALQEKGGSMPGALPRYTDSYRIASWALPEVERLQAMGFASKNDRELLRPGDAATRAEAAEVLNWYRGLA